MPVYDYICSSKSCNGRVLDYLKRGNKPHPLCPKCGKHMTQVIGGSSILFHIIAKSELGPNRGINIIP